jgi:membrane-associated phospholipid phosphatase
MKHPLKRWFRWFGPQLAPYTAVMGTTGLAVCLMLLIGLAWLCQEVFERETFRLDTTILLGIHQWANPALDRVMLSLTRLGDPEFVVVIVILTLGWLLWQQQRQEAKLLAIACLGALLLNQSLKLFFTRPRPLLWTRLITETSYSFPSGHALGSVVLYGFLAYVLAAQFPTLSRGIYGAAIGIITAIGFSRLYLGVHYPSDIIAGYTVGFLWLSVCLVVLRLHTQAK